MNLSYSSAERCKIYNITRHIDVYFRKFERISHGRSEKKQYKNRFNC